jgi:hypothetical protein
MHRERIVWLERELRRLCRSRAARASAADYGLDSEEGGEDEDGDGGEDEDEEGEDEDEDKDEEGEGEGAERRTMEAAAKKVPGLALPAACSAGPALPCPT